MIITYINDQGHRKINTLLFTHTMYSEGDIHVMNNLTSIFHGMSENKHTFNQHIFLFLKANFINYK